MTVWTITEDDMKGMSIRLDMLSTHYRKPKDLTPARLNAAAKTLRRWYALCVPSRDGPPLEVLEALCDDLNTVAAIAAMHKLAGNNQGRELFASLRLIGLIPGESRVIDYDLISEVKTIPIGHIPLPQWNAFAHEFATGGDVSR